ncbi:right-handed parallel beta-helix repeat-containing protein [Sediminibacterium ginsengisoli]|uniref:Parallel beta-helix repeat (Two copies) n=1 Tax=Sediminibacterium ginsengisoli TaxID=413434 RepID=A0A1T4P6J5_9BACT|nr:right-handed parallel beta-helix repeat-containing protein [Sediminibacterium ginsengisoli]SJZ87021.1 parallel beta-helix repeat (two copies) [Sediminibacterium ginsengisoli]
MVITESVVIARDVYRIKETGAQSVILIRGNNITVDFNEAVLTGSTDDGMAPQQYEGIAIRIAAGSANITIRNATVTGYRTALMAENANQVSVINCRLGYNRRPLAGQTDVPPPYAEMIKTNPVVLFSGCSEIRFTGNRLTNGQDGLILYKSNNGIIRDNTIAFNNGTGIRLVNSSGNRVSYNRADRNIALPGTGEGTGILLEGESGNNVIAYNSATFCNNGIAIRPGEPWPEHFSSDNFLYGNDVSGATANGFSIIQAKNAVIMKNRISHAENGILLRHCQFNDITDNDLAANKTGILTENCRNINIALNRFDGDSIGINIRSSIAEPDSTRSMNFWVAANRFINNYMVFHVQESDSIALSGNRKDNYEIAYDTTGRVTDLDIERDDDLLELDYQKDARLKQIPDTILTMPAAKASEPLVFTQWGPYDHSYPYIRQLPADSSGNLRLELCSPPGKWQVRKTEGYEQMNRADSISSILLFKIIADKQAGEICLLYEGGAYTDVYGRPQSGTGQTFCITLTFGKF